MPPEEFSINMLLNAYLSHNPQKQPPNGIILAQIMPQNQTACSGAVRDIPGYSGLHNRQKNPCQSADKSPCGQFFNTFCRWAGGQFCVFALIGPRMYYALAPFKGRAVRRFPFI
jgi:hypothetical protein